MASAAVEKVRRAFNAGVTKPLAWRRDQISAIQRMIKENEDVLREALVADLGVNEFWASGVELETASAECKHLLHGLNDWVKPEKVSTPILSQPGSSYIKREPFGVALIISPWNYPISLLLAPMAAAFAAGNSCVLKPSEVSENSARIMGELLPRYVDMSAVSYYEGGVPETSSLLRERFDVIMYTGNGMVGRIVMRAAAEHLTPVILELGGKCPAIVAPDASITNAAKRIVWGKWSLNNGQTCLSPDYVLVTEANRAAVLDALTSTVEAFYTKTPKTCPDVSRMINERHAQRVVDLLDDDTIDVVIGGDHDVATKYVAPTIVTATPESKVMQDEIFGPILPVVTVRDMAEAVEFVNARDKPLGLYVFSNSSDIQTMVLDNTSSGGACVNDVVMHASNGMLPFGGVGASGMGAYHGKHGFDAFSHKKAVFVKYGSDPSLRFPPYTASKLVWLRRLRSLSFDISPKMMYFVLISIAIALYLRYGRSRI